jgi:hypothetical protein
MPTRMDSRLILKRHEKAMNQEAESAARVQLTTDLCRNRSGKSHDDTSFARWPRKRDSRLLRLEVNDTVRH